MTHTLTRSRLAGDPYEIEGDYSFDDLIPSKDLRKPRLSIDKTDDDLFPLEYQWLRDSGLDDEAIAAKLGVEQTGLPWLLQKAGIAPPLDPIDQAVHDTLERLIAAGEPFTARQLPAGTEARMAGNLLRTARSSGRIVKVGEARSAIRSVNTIWQAATAVDQP
ncbi:hypothetical protein O4215_20495 [Rhodococcus maanshanensis]|uniref:hypothetical protein n=1 Tax=Rhodococcus maanshanensis TaxID=183556 RepID=UPI0022B37F6F|nr:hypothetical protein [Rhodococcus maanshanensis]MCZ4557944.1 hypothetical protein [Rhodococcus maanshanensis]